MKNISIFFEKKPLKMICLGFSSGLPILLVFSTLSVWLVKAGISRSTVTLFSWAGFAYAFKYLWSPLVDNYKLPMFKKFGAIKHVINKANKIMYFTFKLALLYFAGILICLSLKNFPILAISSCNAPNGHSHPQKTPLPQTKNVIIT